MTKYHLKNKNGVHVAVFKATADIVVGEKVRVLEHHNKKIRKTKKKAAHVVLEKKYVECEVLDVVHGTSPNEQGCAFLTIDYTAPKK